ncbi:hypothetical protein BZA77DRAFT_279463 [Pyronema omphalodes]|nr:hypothetical protein BZA77DRAFT_279463 [Pyronema omphalodes]
MVSQKRGQRQLSDDSEEYEDERSPAQAKRARIQESADEDNDEVFYDKEGRMDEDALDQIMTQRIINKNALGQQENIAAEGGVVTKIVCENFMCHRYLEIPLGPFLNFVIGHNGSGKSAVLTALTLCLGGKPQATSRGTALKSFIKEGQDTARITVCLKNGGNDAYRQDVYGDLIKVQRIFSKDGGSQYKLKSRDDKIISNKKEELEAIADHYGLQVDNPMTILSQDQAKQFLNTSTNVEKYKFFHRGVQLSQLDQDYKLISIAIKNTEQMLLSKQEALEILKAKVAEAEQKVKMHESQDGLRKQFDEVRGQCVWIQVQSAKEHVDEHESRLVTITDRIQQAEAARDEASAFYEDADKKMEAATKRIAEQNTEVEKAEEEKKMVQDNIDHNKNEIIKIVGEIRKVHPEIKKSDGKIRDIEGKIANEERRLAERNGGSSSRLKEQIDQANLEIQELKEEIKKLELKHSTEEDELRELSHRKKKIRDRIDAKQNDLKNARNLLDSLSQAGRTFMSVFHQSIHGVLKDIENERRWRDKPIGPLGSYVTLKDPKWMDIVERFFGASLEGFVVTNHQDGQLLKEILKKNRCNSQFYVSAPAQFTPDEPSERFKTILRILDISNDAVRRQFIVSNACEQAILIEDLEEANEVMSRRQPGDHIQQCFALNAKHPGMGHRVGGAIGVKSVTPVPRWGRASRMRSQNNNLQIDSTKLQIQELQQEIQQLNQQLQEIDQKMSQFNRSTQSFNSRRRNMMLEVTRRQDRIDDWNAKIEVMAADGQLGVLQQTLKVLQDAKQGYVQQISGLESRQEELKRIDENLQLEMRGVEQDLQVARQGYADAQRDAEAISQRRHSSLIDKNKAIDRATKLRDLLVSSEAELEEYKKVHQEYIAQALQVSPPVDIPAGATYDSITRRLNSIKKELEQAEKALGESKEQSINTFTTVATEYHKSKAQFQTFDSILSAAAKALDERIERFKKFQDFISARARAQFQFMMSERAFRGRLRLEHHMKPPELIIEVQPGSDNSGSRAPKTLSGGERSFSTICLLLSLWEAMGSPIRCLDEFDVFMDSVNRSISVSMMIAAAERSIGKQFVFITPQSMDRAVSTKCKIYRMPDPERGNQTRLTA